MSFKNFYIKQIGPKTELVIGEGMVDKGYMVMFVRNKETLEIVEDYGIMEKQQAINKFNICLEYGKEVKL